MDTGELARLRAIETAAIEAAKIDSTGDRMWIARRVRALRAALTVQHTEEPLVEHRLNAETLPSVPDPFTKDTTGRWTNARADTGEPRADVVATYVIAYPWPSGSGAEAHRQEAIAALDAARAVTGELARLREALDWAMAPNPRYEGRHRTEPRCRVFMPTDGRCDCGYEQVRAALVQHTEPPRARSLVCSITEHGKCDGNAPNGPAGVGSPCSCSCHLTVQHTEEEEAEPDEMCGIHTFVRLADCEVHSPVQHQHATGDKQ